MCVLGVPAAWVVRSHSHAITCFTDHHEKCYPVVASATYGLSNHFFLPSAVAPSWPPYCEYLHLSTICACFCPTLILTSHHQTSSYHRETILLVPGRENNAIISRTKWTTGGSSSLPRSACCSYSGSLLLRHSCPALGAYADAYRRPTRIRADYLWYGLVCRVIPRFCRAGGGLLRAAEEAYDRRRLPPPLAHRHPPPPPPPPSTTATAAAGTTACPGWLQTRQRNASFLRATPAPGMFALVSGGRRRGGGGGGGGGGQTARDDPNPSSGRVNTRHAVGARGMLIRGVLHGVYPPDFTHISTH